METPILTKEEFYEVLSKQTRVFNKLLQKSKKEFECKLEAERFAREEERIKSKQELEEKLDAEKVAREEERIKSKREFEEKLEAERIARNEERIKSRKEFNENLGGLTNSWGDFLEGLAKPGILELFNNMGIEIHNALPRVKEYKDKLKYYEIDLLLFNDIYVVAVEIKSILTKNHINQHLARINKIQTYPPKILNLKGKKIIAAIAAISIEDEVINYAIKNGFYVMVQKSNLIEIVNRQEFTPKQFEITNDEIIYS